MVDANVIGSALMDRGLQKIISTHNLTESFRVVTLPPCLSFFFKKNINHKGNKIQLSSEAVKGTTATFKHLALENISPLKKSLLVFCVVLAHFTVFLGSTVN